MAKKDSTNKIALRGGPNIFAGLREELKQVTWPTRQEATELTVTVIILSLIVALFVGIIDISLAKVLEMLSQ